LMESENKLLESKLSTTQCEMSELLSSLSLLNGEKAEMNNRLNDAQKEIDELKHAVDVLKGELSDLRQNHQNEVESVTSQLKTAISERDIFSENITSIKSKFLELEERMVTTTNEKDHVEKRMLLAEKCNADLTDELIVAEQKRVEFTEKLSEADQENTELKRLMNEYRVGKEEAIMAQEAIERECAQLRARLEQTSQNLEADSCQSQYNELQLSFLELQTVANKLTSDREQLQKENFSLKEEYASIRKLVEVSSVGILELEEQQKLQEYELVLNQCRWRICSLRLKLLCCIILVLRCNLWKSYRLSIRTFKLTDSLNAIQKV
jgi:predicted  nucleic acid-binding Zn-ribbon protein